MKILKTLKIGYEDYTIEYWNPTHATTTEAYGEFFAKEKKIGIDGAQTGAALVNTVVHEALHGVCYQLGLQLKDDEEERICNSMANGLTQILKDNPDFVEWIRQNINKP